MRILLIEDNPADASLISDLFKLKYPKGTLICRNTLRTAIDDLSINNYNLILLDLGLPDSDGLKTYIRLRGETTLPIVILTGNRDEKLALRAVKAGAQDYLNKGSEGSMLFRSINFAIERHARNDNLNSVKTKADYNKAIDSLKTCVQNINTYIDN